MESKQSKQSSQPTHIAPRPPRQRHRMVWAAALAAGALLGAGCTSTESVRPTAHRPVQLIASLKQFDRCDEYLDYVKAEALKQVGPYGLNGYGGGPIPMGTMREGSASDTLGGAATAAAPTAAPPTTAANQPAAPGTNNQEANVDEADLVKTDGKRIVSVQQNTVRIVTLTDGVPALTATIDLGQVYADRLFLKGDTAYVLVNASIGIANTTVDGAMPEIGTPFTPLNGSEIVQISLAGEPKIVDRVQLEGQILDGRMANGAIRLVINSAQPSRLRFSTPDASATEPDGSKNEDASTDRNRKIIEDSKISDWVPNLIDDQGKTTPLVSCDNLYHPAEFSGFSLLSVITITDGVDSVASTGVLADGGVTYASDANLYVATTRWGSWNQPVAKSATPSSNESSDDGAEHTDIHQFSISGDNNAAYLASGRIAGHLLNQYSLSEYDDHLRVATTTSPSFASPPPPTMPTCPDTANCITTSDDQPTVESQSDSNVVVLQRDGQGLVETGSVHGIGKGEEIQSVRYVGDTAYMVTFRRTDPFFVIDLSDPSDPKVAGELKLPGFSQYLHPVGDHLVLGVGVDGTENGATNAAKLALFDTSDPTRPKEIALHVVNDASFMVGYDPHAFAWDPERHTAYLPMNAWCGPGADCGSAQWTQVLVVSIDKGSISAKGWITHEDRTPSDVAPPSTTVPSTTVPSTTTSSTTVPSTTVPSTTTLVPTTLVPNTTIPGTSVPIAIGGTSGASSPSAGSSSAPSDASGTPSIGVCDPATCDVIPSGPTAPTINRVIVIGDYVITLSDMGVASHRVGSLEPVGYAPFR